MTVSHSIIITGGNTGLGFETAKAVADDNRAMVVFACRDAQLGNEAVAKLTTLGDHAIFLHLDLADQGSISQFVEVFHDAGMPPLKGIICNAGMQNAATPTKTAQGYETIFAVNHLGHYLLTRLLLAYLEPDACITFVSSGTHDPKEKTGLPEPRYENATAAAQDFEPGRTAGLRRYTTSKLCNIYNATNSPVDCRNRATRAFRQSR